jgi:hypothetical protein
MLARLPSLTIVRLWAAIMLAAIGLQATIPAGASSHASMGSAFSAATSEVALYVQRGERVQTQAIAPQPLTPALAAASQPAPLQVIRFPAARSVRPDATGPPLRHIRSWKPAPRAPPRA